MLECFFQLNSSFHHYGFAYQKAILGEQWTRDNKYILKIQLFTFLKDLSVSYERLLVSCAFPDTAREISNIPNYCWMFSSPISQPTYAKNFDIIYVQFVCKKSPVFDRYKLFSVPLRLSCETAANKDGEREVHSKRSSIVCYGERVVRGMAGRGRQACLWDYLETDRCRCTLTMCCFRFHFFWCRRFVNCF